MNNDRLIVLENVANQPVGVKDTQNRSYRLTVGGKIRISEVSLQDILDYRPSKVLFDEGMIKIHNIDPMKLYNMGLTETEISKYCVEDTKAPTVVITSSVEEPVEEEVIIVPETKEEEVLEEVKPVEKVESREIPAAKKPTTKKSSKK